MVIRGHIPPILHGADQGNWTCIMQ